MKIADILNSPGFSISGKIKVFSIAVDGTKKTVFDSTVSGDFPFDIVNETVSSISVSDDNYLVIGYETGALQKDKAGKNCSVAMVFKDCPGMYSVWYPDKMLSDYRFEQLMIEYENDGSSVSGNAEHIHDELFSN